MQQIFTDGFVHADPHPGNLFIDPANGGEGASPAWELTFVDFGMVTRVSPEIRQGLRELAIGLGSRDPSRMAHAYQMLGILLPGADLKLIQDADARVFDRLWGKSMAELRDLSYEEMRQLSRDFREVLYQMPFQVPQNLILLFRTIAILSGMCTGLNPNFNLWENLAPFAQQFIAEEMGSGLTRWLREAVNLLSVLIQTPPRLNRLMAVMEAGELEVRAPQISEQVQGLEFAVRRLVGALIFAALLVSGVQVYLSGQIVLGGLLLAGALLALAWVILARR
jgi:predicted unusual protein kinase regulating ubiquinone biosynthesis (AarF/ABC1/UbiB family)